MAFGANAAENVAKVVARLIGAQNFAKGERS